jgi:hypothetical protein
MNWGCEKRKEKGRFSLIKKKKWAEKPPNRSGSARGPRRSAPHIATWRDDTRAGERSHSETHTDPEKWLGSAVDQLMRPRKPNGSDP